MLTKRQHIKEIQLRGFSMIAALLLSESTHPGSYVLRPTPSPPAVIFFRACALMVPPSETSNCKPGTQ
jgi:hypothetical protein